MATWIIKTFDGQYRLGNMWTVSQNLATRYTTKHSAKDVMWSSCTDCRVVRLRTNKQRKEGDRAALILILENRIAALEAHVEKLLRHADRMSIREDKLEYRVSTIEADLGHPMPLQEYHQDE